MTSTNNSGGIGAWFVRMLSRILLLLIFFVAGALTMHIGMHADDHDNMVAMQATINSQDKQLTELQTQLDDSKNQLTQSQSSASELSSKITELQSSLGQVQDELAFYEQLIPAGPSGSLSIRAFTIDQDDDHLNYRLLLTRNVNAGSDALVGELKFTASGMRNGKKVQLELKPVAAGDITPEPIKLNLDRFQRNTGVLQLDQGFKLQSVQLDIVQGDSVIATAKSDLGQ